jgi:hypothetical protein
MTLFQWQSLNFSLRLSWQTWNVWMNILTIIMKNSLWRKRAIKILQISFVFLTVTPVFSYPFVSTAFLFPFAVYVPLMYLIPFPFVSSVPYNNRPLFKTIMSSLSPQQALFLFSSLFSSDKRLLNPFCPTGGVVAAARHCSFWSVDPLSRAPVD